MGRKIMNEGEKNLIINYVLERRDYLEISIKIWTNFDEIRKRVIISFLEMLEKDLRESLDRSEWIVKNELKENVFERWKRFYIAKREWKDNYFIGISPEQNQARRFLVGVQKKPDLKPIQEGKLKAALDNVYWRGIANEYYEWYGWLDHPYSSWDNEEVLLKMYEKNEAVSYFKGLLLKMKEISSPMIDEAIKSK